MKTINQLILFAIDGTLLRTRDASTGRPSTEYAMRVTSVSNALDSLYSSCDVLHV